MKKILFTGGGTAGHITPNIALFDELKNQGYSIAYIGMKNSMEETLIKKEQVDFYSINGGKLRRYFDFKNFIDIFKIIIGFFQSLFIILRLKPHIVFSKGGFVSCPVVWSAWLLKIPVIVHESDISPGLANRLSFPFSKKICYSFPETYNNIPKNKEVFTGLPIRKTIFEGNRNIGLKICNFNNEKPIVLVFGGSLGSNFINNVIRNKLNTLLEYFQICHICGKSNLDKALINTKGYAQFEYTSDEFPHLLYMADIVIARAGATSIFEILSLCKPNILIPLTKKASRGDQILNARSFEKLGFSKVLYEENNFDIKEQILEVFEKKEKYISAMKLSQNTNGTQNIIELITKLSKF